VEHEKVIAILQSQTKSLARETGWDEVREEVR